MKLTFFLLTAAFLQISARGVSQKVTFSGKDVPLQKVFTAIEKQTGYVFFYNNEDMAKARSVTIDLKNASLQSALDETLKDQPLSYDIKGNTVFVKVKPVTDNASDVLNGFFPPPLIDIHGRITDPDGEPLLGATVKVTGSNAVAVTDGDGRFTLKGVDENASIEITYVGFVTENIPVKNRANIFLALKRSDSKLDEVQVIAYGTTSQRLSTGNVTTVKGEDIQKQPVSNPLLALEGRVPGLFVTQANGINGGGITVRIQGQNSINGGNYPLYIIDGIPFSSQTLSTFGGPPNPLGKSDIAGSYDLSTVGNPLNYINPSDIESIEVLKDADATAIYGSRAANGAILITTKKGKTGPTKLDINIQNGWGKVNRSMEMMSTQQYIQMRNEAFRNDNLIPSANPSAVSPFVYAPDLMLWDTTHLTNWRKALIGGTAQYANINGTVSGGNASTQYLIGATYNRNSTVFPGNFDDQKATLHFNINSSSSNQKFHITLSGSYMFDNNQLPSIDLTQQAYSLPPNAPALYNPDGTLNWALNSLNNSSWTNPLSTTLTTYENKTNNLFANALVSYRILPGLDLKSSFGYTKLENNEYGTVPFASIAPQSRTASGRTAYYALNNISTWTIDPQVTYKRTIGKGKLDALIGTTILQTNSDGQSLAGLGYNSDIQLHDFKSASQFFILGTVAAAYKYNAIFARINYNWVDKYIINIAARRDGSSRFGPQSQFHNFASIGGAWIFNEEDFIKKHLNFLSFGKLRASYGTTGNDQIGDYSYIDLYNSNTPLVPYQGISGLQISRIPNPYLQWEETRKLSFSIDLGFLEDRVLLNASYSRNRSSNQLLSYSLPIITGFSGVTENFPATVQNTSLEFALNTINIKSKDFKWSSNFNLTIPKNKLQEFPNLATSTASSSLMIGQPVNIIKAYHFLGVDPATGLYIVADRFGNATSSPNSTLDKTVIVDKNPKFYGGFLNSLSYEGLQLDVLFQFVKQVGLANIFFGNSSPPGTVRINQPNYVLNHWQRPGDVTAIEMYRTGSGAATLFTPFNNAVASDASYSDASFIRLKNLSLAYELPNKWIRKAHLQNCRISIEGQNLLTITKYLGLDPEIQSSFSLPPLKVITFGIKIGL